MKLVWQYLKPVRWKMAMGLLIKAIGTLLELLLPYILSRIIDVVVPTRDVHSIIYWSLIMVAASAGAWGFNVLANRNASAVARDTTRRLRSDLFDKSLYLTCAKTDAFTIPSLESRLTSDTYYVHQMLGMLQRMGIRAPIIVLGGFIIMFGMDARLSMVLLATVPFITILIYIRASKGIPLYTGIQQQSDKMVSVVRENYQGIRVIKAFSRPQEEKKRFANVNEELKQREIHANKVMAVISPGMNLMLNLGMLGVIVYGARLVASGECAPGVIVAFMSYFTIISRSLMAVSRIFIMTSRGSASADRIKEVMDSDSEKDWKPGSYANGDPQYAIEFKDVSFSYLKVKDNLQHISFHLKPGETLGVLGAIGAGKSTIIGLLLRFYDVDSGAIYLNGIDVRNMSPRELRSQFGIVMQNDFLFRETVAENIRFGRPVSDDDMEEALESAQASEFVNRLDQKTEYNLTTNGTNVSGGQRQRILLSRAFAGNPKILLLDDSSSALDYKTDAGLRKAMEKNYPDTTKILIAQRVSSIRQCDQILVLEEGKMVDLGTDEQLRERCSLYRSIADSQMGGALFD